MIALHLMLLCCAADDVASGRIVLWWCVLGLAAGVNAVCALRG